MNEAIHSVNSVSQFWAQLVVSLTWQSTLVALVLIAIVLWAKRLPSPVRYAILLVALLKFASPPFLHAPSGIFSSLEVAAVSQSDIGAFDLGPSAIAQNNFDSAFDHSSYDSDSRPLGYQEIDRNEFESQMPLAIRNGLNSSEPQDEVSSSPALSQSAPESARLSIYSWLMLVQILGSLFVVSKLLTEWTRLKRLKSNSNDQLSSHQARLFETIRKRFRFLRQPELLVSNSISAPISFGCWRPKVVIPESVFANENFATIAITHELAHLSRYDSWFNWIQNLLLAVWWYNPVLWLLNGQIRKVREDCCDDIVLASGMATDCEYSNSLVEIAKLSLADDCSGRLQTAFSMARHPLKTRLVRIMNSGLPRAKRLSWSGILAVFVLCALCLPGLRLVIAESGNSEQPNSSSGENVLAQDETIVLTFPEDLEIGTLEVVDLPEPSDLWQGYVSFKWQGKTVGPAVGKVSVPKESFIVLKVTDENLLEKLDHLAGQPIGGLKLNKPTVSAELLARLEKLDSLQQIQFLNCAVDPDIDISKLNGMPNLKEVRCQYRDNSDVPARQQLSIWAAKSKQLQSPYGGGSGAAGLEAIQAFEQHPNPLFLEVNFGENAINKIQALAKIPKLIALNLTVLENVSPDYHEYLGQLEALELANWGGGELTPSLIDGLIEIPSLKRLLFQNDAKPTTEFIERLPELESLRQVIFNVVLSDDEKELLSDIMLEMPSLRSLPKITAASAELLAKLSGRSDITNLNIEGLGADATVEQLAELIRANRDLKTVELEGIDVSEDLVRAICDLKALNHLNLTVQDFEHEKFTSFKNLTSLNSMNLHINGKVRDLSVLASLPNLNSIQISVNSSNTGLWQFVGDCPKLRGFEILIGVSDDRLADWVAQNPSLRAVSPGQDMFMTDAGVVKFAECDHLEWLTVGGDISKEAVMSLRRLPNLEYLSVWSDLLSDDDMQELKEVFKDLRDLDLREHFPSIGKLAPSEDGFFRQMARRGSRMKLDALEGQSLEDLLKDSLTPELKRQLKDKVVMVDFWGTWCGPCLMMNPEFELLHELYHEKGFEVLAIHSGSGKEKCEGYLKKHPKPWPNIIDGDGSLEERFAVSSYPGMYFFDRDGKLRVAKAHRIGLADTIESLLNE